MRPWMISVFLGMTVLRSHGQDLRQTAAAKAACGPQETTFNVDALPVPVLPQTGSSKALIYIIEQESSTSGFCIGRCGGLTLKLGLDGRWIGAVNGSSYTVMAVEPGEHHVCAAWRSHVKKLSEKVVLHGFIAEAGKTYYFVTYDLMTSPEAGSMANITLEPANPDQAKMLIESYPQVKATTKK